MYDDECDALCFDDTTVCWYTVDLKLNRMMVAGCSVSRYNPGVLIGNWQEERMNVCHNPFDMLVLDRRKNYFEMVIL